MCDETIEEWLKTRPECVQKLAAEFPHGSRFQTPSGEILYLVGYTEHDSLVVSHIDPFEDYPAALNNKKYIHAECARKDRVKQ